MRILAVVASVIVLASAVSSSLQAQDDDKPVCGSCVADFLLDESGTRIVQIGKCPACKTAEFMNVFGEKICHGCAKKRRVCATCLIAMGWNPELDRVPASAKNRIVFLTDRDGNNEIYSMKPDGADLKRLTDCDASDGDPAVSMDGRWIAFDSNRDGNYEIYMADGTGGNLRRLTRTPEEENHPSWFPDGERLVVAARSRSGYQLHVIDRKGENRIQLGIDEGLQTGFPEVSPDGTRIVFAGTRNPRDSNSFEIYTWDMPDPKDPAIGKLKRLTDNEFVDSYPSFSPDGKRIAFVSNRKGDDDIFLMKPDGSDVQCLVHREGIDTLPWFAPDGKKVAYVSLLDPDKGLDGTEIFTITADGKATERITNNEWKETTLRWR